MGEVSVLSMKALIIGNSDGIGLEVTRRLLARGVSCIGISRSPSPLSDTTDYDHHVCDVRTPDYAELLSSMTCPDLVVYCVGIGDAVDVATMEGEATVFVVNLLAAVRSHWAGDHRVTARNPGHRSAQPGQGDR